jgi:response regulator NasT
MAHTTIENGPSSSGAAAACVEESGRVALGESAHGTSDGAAAPSIPANSSANRAAGNPQTDPGRAQGSGSAGRRVLIVEDDTLVGLGLKANLERLGHVVVGQAATASEATAMFRERLPDIVLMDIRLDGVDGVDGIELATRLLKERPCPMIVLSAYSDRELVDRAADAGVFGYLIKPVSGEGLQAQIEVACRRFREHEQLLREKQELTQTLETRKLVERAKGIFMKRLGLDEPEAHRRLQQESQKRRMSLADLAKKIIESEELLGGA